MTAHITTTGDRPAETLQFGERVLIESTVHDIPRRDDEAPDRYYTFDIQSGNGLRTLATVREDHVRKAVRRIPEPQPEPTMVRADLLTGCEIEVADIWYLVGSAILDYDGQVRIYLPLLGTIKFPVNAMIPARPRRERP